MSIKSELIGLLLRNPDYFYCKKHSCKMRKSVCIERQKSIKNKRAFYRQNIAGKLLLPTADEINLGRCRNCKQGDSIKKGGTKMGQSNEKEGMNLSVNIRKIKEKITFFKEFKNEIDEKINELKRQLNLEIFGEEPFIEGDLLQQVRDNGRILKHFIFYDINQDELKYRLRMIKGNQHFGPLVEVDIVNKFKKIGHATEKEMKQQFLDKKLNECIRGL